MAKWVALRPIFGFCERDTGYKGGGGLRVLWWIQKAAENQLKFTVEAIPSAARVWRRLEYDRYGRSKGGSEGRGHGQRRIGMRQVTLVF